MGGGKPAPGLIDAGSSEDYGCEVMEFIDIMMLCRTATGV
jgi:hypothetical protein